MYCATSSALVLSCLVVLAPLNWKILVLVSRTNTSECVREERAKGTCRQRAKEKDSRRIRNEREKEKT